MNPQADPNDFDKLIPATISLLLTGFVSVLIGIYFEKFRNKITFLKYKMFFQPLATTYQNEYWGDIAVFHNNRIVKHLSFVTVELKNDSNQDIENINVDTWVDNDSQFLAIKGNYNESGNSIFLEQVYSNYYNNVLQRNLLDSDALKTDPDHETPPQLMNEIRVVMSNKKFHLPVFNRHTSITLHLLIENFKGLKPIVTISVLHKSVKLILEEDKDIERKRTTIWMISIGLVIYLFSFYLLLRYYSESTLPLFLSAVIGLTYTIIGLGIYKLGLFVKRFFW